MQACVWLMVWCVCVCDCVCLFSCHCMIGRSSCNYAGEAPEEWRSGLTKRRTRQLQVPGPKMRIRIAALVHRHLHIEFYKQLNQCKTPPIHVKRCSNLWVFLEIRGPEAVAICLPQPSQRAGEGTLKRKPHTPKSMLFRWEPTLKRKPHTRAHTHTHILLLAFVWPRWVGLWLEACWAALWAPWWARRRRADSAHFPGAGFPLCSANENMEPFFPHGHWSGQPL